MNVWLVTPDRNNTRVFKTKKQALEYIKSCGLIKDKGFYVVTKDQITEFDVSLDKWVL